MATVFPKFAAQLSIEHEQIREEGIEVEVKVSIDLEKTKPPAITKKGVMNLYASLLVLTSDNYFIEYRRCPLAAIAKGSIKPFTVSVILIKPSQRIVVSVSCDLLAGSEVRAEVKPAAKAADFPVPGLASAPENNMEELRGIDQASTSSAKALAVTHPNLQKRTAPVVLSDEGDREPRMVGDGKYACNHNCRDKTRCKHLCCREGLDKPPRLSVASKKRKLSISQFDNIDLDSTASSKPQYRIPMKASSGVTLVQDDSGKTVTRTRSSDQAASSIIVSGPRRTGSDASAEQDFDDIDFDHDGEDDLPTPDQLVTSSAKYKKKGKKVVTFAKPSLARSPSPIRSQNASFVPLASKFALARQKRRAPSFDKSALALGRTSKLVLTEFESSDEEVEDKALSAGSIGSGKPMDQENEKPVFSGTAVREDELSVDPLDTLYASTDVRDGLSETDEEAAALVEDAEVAEKSEGVRALMEVEDEYSGLDWDTALAIAESYEGSEASAQRVQSETVGKLSEPLSLEIEERTKGETHDTQPEDKVEEAQGEEEYDVFEDWLAQNVIIKD